MISRPSFTNLKVYQLSEQLADEIRKNGRNKEWIHLHNDDILSMPDKWEYPWFPAWDLAFHCIPLAMVDVYLEAILIGAALFGYR